MESEKVFPKKDRLGQLEINELEGYRSLSGWNQGERASLITTNKNELLVRYHNALEAAEKELQKYNHIDEGVDRIKSTLDKYFPNE